MYGMSESGDNGDELGMRNGSEEGQGKVVAVSGVVVGWNKKMGDERLVN